MDSLGQEKRKGKKRMGKEKKAEKIEEIKRKEQPAKSKDDKLLLAM